MADKDAERNEDWIKTLRWDLGSFDALLAYLGVEDAPDDQKRAALADFKQLPAWEAAPPDVKQRAAALERP